VNKADPITWLDVFATVSPLLAALLAVSGVLGTIYFSNRRESDRQEHERLLKDAELEAAREVRRLRDERIAAYRKLLAATTTAHVDREGVAALATAYAEISLLASTDEIDRAAAEVWVRYGTAQRISDKSKRGEDTGTDFSQALNKAQTATDKFLTLARAELRVKGRSEDFLAVVKGWSEGFRDLEGSSPGEAIPGPETSSSRRGEDVSG
jgi:hypothetical protein